MDRQNKLQFSDILLLAHDFNWWKQEQDKLTEREELYKDSQELEFFNYIWDLLDVQKVKDYIKKIKLDFDLGENPNIQNSIDSDDLENCEEMKRYKKKKGDK